MFAKIKEAIEPMRYEGGAQAALYWFIRVASIAVPVLLLLCIAGVVYCKMKGIEIVLPF